LTSFVLAPAAARAAWSNVAGGPLDSTTSIVTAPTAAAIGGVPYVAWADQGSLLVKHWNGTTWVQDGGALNVTPGARVSDHTIAGVGGVPYVAWTEAVSGQRQQVYVKHWNGSAWVENDSPLNLSSDDANEPWITDVGGVPYVAFVQDISGSPSQIDVEHWDAGQGTWVDDSASPLNVSTSEIALQPSIADVGGVPYVAFQENTGSGKFTVYVEHLNAGQWVLDGAGGLNFSGTDSAFVPTIASIGGVPYVAFVDSANGGPQNAYVKHWNGTDWIADGASLNPDPAQSLVQGVSLLDVGGTPYAAASALTSASTSQVFVRRWTGSGWDPAGVPPAQAVVETSGEALTNVGGVPFLASAQAAASSPVAAIDVAALAPDFSSEQSIATDTGALLVTRVKDYDTPLPVFFQYGLGASPTSATAPQATDGSGSSTIVQAITGLSPSTAYSWRPLSTDGASPIAIGPLQTFTTEPSIGLGPVGQAGPTGPAGPTGSAGKVELVTCKAVTRTVTRRVNGHPHKVKVTVQKCTAKLVNGPVRFTVASAHAARLVRGRVVYARVEVLSARGTTRFVVVRAVRRLTAGRYTLISGRTRQAIQLR
jgi:hypothetical protein